MEAVFICRGGGEGAAISNRDDKRCGVLPPNKRKILSIYLVAKSQITGTHSQSRLCTKATESSMSASLLYHSSSALVMQPPHATRFTLP